MISRAFQTVGACVKRGSKKHLFGLSFFRPSGQSNISTSGEQRFKYPLPWENKVSQRHYPGPIKTMKPPPHALPPPCPAPPPHRHPPRWHDIDKCITNKHVVYGVMESRRIRGTELYRQLKTLSCTLQLESNFSLNQAWPQWPR